MPGASRFRRRGLLLYPSHGASSSPIDATRGGGTRAGGTLAGRGALTATGARTSISLGRVPGDSSTVRPPAITNNGTMNNNAVNLGRRSRGSGWTSERSAERLPALDPRVPLSGSSS